MTSYLKTTGGLLYDQEWEVQLLETAAYIKAQTVELNLGGWIWAGDFNFQPTAIIGKPDKSKRRRDKWELIIEDLTAGGDRPCLLNPTSGSCEVSDQIPRWATQKVGLRGINLVLCSATMADKKRY